MKKIICFVMTIILLCPLVSCNNDVEPTADTTNSTMKNTSPQYTYQETSAQVNNIFLSKSELTLSIGEKETLIATISPGNITAKLTWSSSNTNVADVDTKGQVIAKSEGSTVIKVQASNGVLAVCNVILKVKTGSVTGEVTYKYNKYVGNKADTGATVILISKSVKNLPDELGSGSTYNLPDGCYTTKVSGNGNYTFDNIPVGEYYLIIISKNTNEDPDRVTFSRTWGEAWILFSSEGQKNALLHAKIHKIRSTTITINEGKATTYSYDFGITYI